MASPQKENGYISIANELWIALLHIDLREYERKYLMALLAKTYGFNKKEDWISNSQFCEMTGLKKGHVYRTEKQLIKRKIIICNGKKKSINKNYEEWLCKKGVSPRGYIIKDKVSLLGYSVSPRGYKKYPHEEDTKDIKTLSKDIPDKSGNKKIMKKNSFNYSEVNSSDSYEDIIDSDTGQKIGIPKTNANKVFWELLAWAEKRRGFKFLNVKKQFKAFSIAKTANITPNELMNRWAEFEKDKFWKEKGFDFFDVVNNFSKKR